MESASDSGLSTPAAELLRIEFPDDRAGRRAAGGFIYQHLYVLRLMRRLFDGELDAYVCENGTDFLATKTGSDGEFVKLELIEIKSRSNAVFGKNRGEARIQLEKLAALAVVVANRYPKAALLCRLVFSRGEDDSKSDEDRLDAIRQEVVFPEGCEFRAEAFVAAEPTADEMQTELTRLCVLDAQLAPLFNEARNRDAFLETLIGLTLPFHSPRCVRSLASWLDSPGLRVGSPALSARRALETVQNAVNRLLAFAGTRREVQSKIVCNDNEPLAGVKYKTLPIHRADDPKWWKLGDQASAKRLLRVAAVLPATDSALASKIQYWRDSAQFFVEYDLSGLVPLREYLARPTTTYRNRHSLALSFAKAINRWAIAGVLIKSHFAEDAHRWLVRISKGQPEFVKAGLDGLAVFDRSRGLVDSRWIWTAPLAASLMELFYGCRSIAEASKATVKKYEWDDLVMADFAEWLLTFPAVKAADLSLQLSRLFESSQHWPIFISAVDSQFLRDALNAGVNSPLEALCEAQPHSWQMAGGRVHREITYARCTMRRGAHEVQVGLLYNGDGTFTAYRYFRYGFERWISYRDRDREIETPLLPPKGMTATFVIVQRAAEWRNVASQFFDVLPEEAQRWVTSSITTLRRAARPSESVPAYCRHEHDLHRIRKRRLESLRERRLRCKVHGNGGKLIVATDKNAFERHVEYCGYRPDEIDGLRLNAEDDSATRVRGEIRPGVGQGGDTLHLTLNPLPDSALTLADGAWFELVDRGQDAVVGAEEALFNSLIESFKVARPEAPRFARQAWDFIASLVGERIPGETLPSQLWTGHFRKLRKHDGIEVDAVHPIMEALENSVAPLILTGAPGTGKTRTVADLVARYLDQNAARDYPPCRVLVVANTHWAVDNFVRTFQRDTTRKHLIIRKLSPISRARLGEESAGRREYFEELDRTFDDAVRPNLPQMADLASHRGTLATHRAHLERLRETLRAAEGHAKVFEHACLIPSHAAWRAESGFFPAFCATTLARTGAIVEETLRGIQAYESSATAPIAGDAHLADLDAYAAQLVAVTVDGLRRLPDMGFDLVIFEEASQLTVTAILKVLTQVIRGCGPKATPHVILSGDPQQLPPYREYQLPDCVRMNDPGGNLSRAHARSRSSAAFFSTVCAHSATRVKTLTVQHRMHPEIATLVANLFYRDEDWRYREMEGANDPAVYWIDPIHFPGQCEREAAGPSLLHSGEAEIVRRLFAAHQDQDGRFLAVTPYCAQQRLLEAIVTSGGACSTIDGCQGIEADTVVFSFVCMKPFVLHPGRLNVALSRARKRLYLVGSFSELCAATVDEYRRPRPHISGLAWFFSSDGPFASRRLTPTPDSWPAF